MGDKLVGKWDDETKDDTHDGDVVPPPPIFALVPLPPVKDGDPLSLLFPTFVLNPPTLATAAAAAAAAAIPLCAADW